MSFPVDAYYLIEPHPSLEARLRGRVDEEFIDLLLDPLLIRHYEGDLRHVILEQIPFVKLLFLAGLTDYPPFATVEGFERILGTSRIGTELFDRYWILQPLGFAEDSKELRKDLRRVISRVDPVGSAGVDGYLDTLRSENGDPSD